MMLFFILFLKCPVYLCYGEVTLLRELTGMMQPR